MNHTNTGEPPNIHLNPEGKLYCQRLFHILPSLPYYNLKLSINILRPVITYR